MARVQLAALIVVAAAMPAVAFERGSSTALIDQARSMIEARGAPAQTSEGFALMKRIADEGEGPAAALAQWNVGNFYLNGIGTTASFDDALVYLGKAEAAGMPEAAALLRRIRKR